MNGLQAVRRVEIEINSMCNRECSYCPNSYLEREVSGFMSEENFIHILMQLKKSSYTGLIAYHFYGEPLLHPNLENFIRLTKEILPESRPTIYSNGVLLSQDKFQKLSKLGARFIITKHEKDKTIPLDTFISALSEKDKKTLWYWNYKNLAYTNRGGLLDSKNRAPVPLSRRCLIPATNITITLRGGVLPCFEDYREKHVMGNIFKQDLLDIWQSKPYVEFRENLKRGERSKYDICSKCDSYICFI